jgi:hypothetical protein
VHIEARNHTNSDRHDDHSRGSRHT